MDVRQLRYFLAVAEELHFGRAAERLFMAQPPLSQQIRKLEEELGASLFRRTNRKVELTVEGQALKQRAENILGSVREAQDHVRDLASGITGQVRVCFQTRLTESRIPRAFRAFRNSYPDVRLNLKTAGTGVMLNMLREGSIDIGIISSVQPFEEFPSMVCVRERYQIAVPRGHRLACSEGPLDLAQCDGEVFIDVNCGGGNTQLSMLIHDAVRKSGAVPAGIEKVGLMIVAEALVAAGMGIALIPELHFRHRRNPDVVVREIADPMPGIVNLIVWNDERITPAVRNLLDIMAEYCEPFEGDPYAFV